MLMLMAFAYGVPLYSRMSDTCMHAYISLGDSLDDQHRQRFLTRTRDSDSASNSNLGLGTRDLGFGIRDLGYGIRNTREY